ncbi:isoprenoid synthase domain-containing protein [Aspergillus alliaceus]|uniref:Isoprenoid synthase domain-containing protein n=1 Tax=Petromyces alliaceus TaxID=209559 RepID=A0A5N7C6E1_PETAA|nr:isoprenoid synthase domain-containing protein [Aspergillus alliaceus]
MTSDQRPILLSIDTDAALMDPETESRYISRFQPRVSKYVAISNEACIECHIDLFGTGSIGKVVGGMNAHTADFTALCGPEALPERIGVCSYFIEYAFVHDNVSVDVAQGGGQDNDRTFKQWYETGQEMRDKTFANLEDYLAARALDCGANWVVRMMGWASGVELTPEEEVETGPVTYLAFVVLAVTNDLMQDTTEETAKQMVYNIIREHEEQYCLLRDEYLGRPCTSMSAKKWFQVLELSMAGNALWSIHAPRYHLDVRDPYICPAEIPSVFRELHVVGLKPEAMEDGEAGLESASATGPAYKALGVLDDTVLWKPYEYIVSMPSKAFRHHLIDALQTWFIVLERSLALISGVASLLHEASLM